MEGLFKNPVTFSEQRNSTFKGMFKVINLPYGGGG